MYLESEFASHLAATGIAELTRDYYRRDLHHFFASGKQATEITRRDIQDYFAAELARGISAATIGRRLSSLKKYFVFLLDMEAIQQNPTRGIQPPKRTKKIQRAVSVEEIDLMVNGTDSVRDKAIVLTLFATALRASELLKLGPEDIDFDGLVVHVWSGKGAKDGICPLTPRAAEALKAWMSVRPDTGRLFQMTRVNLWHMIQQLSKRTLGRAISPHRIRAGTATALLKGGSDIRTTQIILRHSSIDTTAIYLDIDSTLLRDSYLKYHPRAK